MRVARKWWRGQDSNLTADYSALLPASAAQLQTAGPPTPGASHDIDSRRSPLLNSQDLTLRAQQHHSVRQDTSLHGWEVCGVSPG